MKRLAMIPARYDAARFPGKLMQIIGDKSVIRHTYDNTLATLLFDEVIVVTDSDVIFKEITENGGYAIKSKKEHESGTDRIAEAAESIEADIILNVQGDEPFIDKNALKKLLTVFDAEDE
jgi:CMP-2-keto-3-deoxyoctulosonic acid synthetase